LPAALDPLDGLTVFERGWLSSNNVLVYAAAGERGAWLVDTSHVNHATQTLALVQRALGGRPLAGIANTHLHSDHCGGNALLQCSLDAPIALPSTMADAVRRWDEDALSYKSTGQRMEAFDWQSLLVPGEQLVAGGRAWDILPTKGHDPHMVMLFDRRQGVLLSADALWENGFGLVFPELEGEPAFDGVDAVLDTIASLPVRVVVPGHGRPFDDVPAALERARKRLHGLRSAPARHARHALKVLLKYHLMEEQSQPMDALLDWIESTPLLRTLWLRFRPAGFEDPRLWAEEILQELLAAGLARLDRGVVFDAG
jgi:glyoxylase-like metal-dependent hydrolase (beta-lactamase superfamily II)